MEDVPVYARAIGEWQAGANPYSDAAAPLYFLYPPAFLFLAGSLARLMPEHWGTALYILADLAAIVALPLILARYFFRQAWLSPGFALLLFFTSSRFTGMRALRTMNIASLLYCLAFAAAIPGLRRNRWEWFYLAVLLAATIKITLLALLLLPLLAGSRQWLRSCACAASVFLVNLAEWAFSPQLFHDFQQSVRNGILNQKAFGYGVFGVLANYRYQELGVGVAPYLVFATMAVLIVGMMFLLRRRVRSGSHPGQASPIDGVWLAMVVLAVALMNPREMQYDMDIAIFAAFILAVHGLRTKQLLLLLVLLFVSSLLVPIWVKNPHLQGVSETVLCLFAFAIGYWRLWREFGTQEQESRLLANTAFGVHETSRV